MAASDSHASEPLAPATIAFLCPGCANQLTVPISFAGVVGPCPHCATTIQSPSVPSAQTLIPLIEPTSVVPPMAGSTCEIQPRGGSRPPQINIRSVNTIDWASDEAREASRRFRSNASTAERIDHRIESITQSNRFENARVMCSVAAVAIMAGTVFFMAKTGWGNPEPPATEPVEKLGRAKLYTQDAKSAVQSPKAYPWREPLPEVKRDQDDPFFTK